VADTTPAEGDRAPDFRLASTEGGDVSLQDFRGKTVVLYFYPKDMTPGCTIEACDFRDRDAALREAGAVVLGVSPDSVESHRTFATKHALPFTLLADPGHVAQKAYGVRRKKSLYGRSFLGVQRSTFLIDGKGVVRRVWRNVKVDGHGDEVLEAVREIQRSS
jgi:peroxiredoxin Q/BCP